LDLHTDLPQIIQDGYATYVYGIDRLGYELFDDYFQMMPDGLGSVRQIIRTDRSGSPTWVNEAVSYDPYGSVIYRTGEYNDFGYAGEFQDSYIKLVDLRSRMYSTETGRFLTRDVWQGDYNTPLSLNKWNYVEGNPINRTDPSGKDPWGCGNDDTCTTDWLKNWRRSNFQFSNIDNYQTQLSELMEYVELGSEPYQYIVEVPNWSALPKIDQYQLNVKKYGSMACGLVSVASSLVDGDSNRVWDVIKKLYDTANPGTEKNKWKYSSEKGIQPSQLYQVAELAYPEKHFSMHDQFSLGEMYIALSQNKKVVVDLLVNRANHFPSTTGVNSYAHFAWVFGMNLKEQKIYIQNTVDGDNAYWEVDLSVFWESWKYPETSAKLNPVPESEREKVTRWALVSN
jgi:RHS repeat-associated protein